MTPRVANWLALSLALPVALLFVYAGSMKLTGEAHMVETFAKVGIGQWFRLLTGAIEVIGGALLLWPRTAAPAALVLACTMLGATIAHMTVLASPPGLAVALLAACLAIAWLRRPGQAQAA